MDYYSKYDSKLSQKKQFIEAEFEELDKNGQKIKKAGHFSLKNPKFIVIIYLSLAFMIFSLLFFAIYEKTKKRIICASKK